MSSPLFCISPFYAAVDQELGHSAHRLLVVLCGFADQQGVCFPPRKMLSMLTGMDNSNLSKYIKILCKKGYLKVLNQSANRYQIVGYDSKETRWPTVSLLEEIAKDNQEDGNGYHGKNYHVVENNEDGNGYHECGNGYHADGKNYHECGNGYQQNRETKEQTTQQTTGAVAPDPEQPVPVVGLPEKSAKPVKAKKPKNEYTPEFEELWGIYPPNTNGLKPKKKEAFGCFNARLKEGVSFDLLKSCTANYCAAFDSGRIKRDFVMHPTTFFGANERYTEYQALIKSTLITQSKSGTYDGNRKLSASEEAASWTVPGKQANQRPTPPAFEDGDSGYTYEHVQSGAE